MVLRTNGAKTIYRHNNQYAEASISLDYLSCV